MSRLREKLQKFMYGRYGIDQLGRFTMYASLILLVLTIFVRNNFLYIIAVAGVIYTYIRMFSKNADKRYKENQAFLNFKYKIVCRFDSSKRRMSDRKTHSIFKCPNCKQKIRVPKGKGNICIKCPNCRIEFIKKT